MNRRPIDPPLACSFRKVFIELSKQPLKSVSGLRTTGKGVVFEAKANTTGDGRDFIDLPHNNRIYEGDWGFQTNSMGKDGQRIGQYARPIDDWCQKVLGG
jgi:hypothetical protein